jgi:hypothetical protein
LNLLYSPTVQKCPAATAAATAAAAREEIPALERELDDVANGGFDVL